MHLNLIKGDFFYKQWNNEDLKQMEIKCKELKNLGYKLKVEYDFLNAYYHYTNNNGDEIILTLLCC